jgi:signal transduction histidine kinase
VCRRLGKLWINKRFTSATHQIHQRVVGQLRTYRFNILGLTSMPQSGGVDGHQRRASDHQESPTNRRRPGIDRRECDVSAAHQSGPSDQRRGLDRRRSDRRLLERRVSERRGHEGTLFLDNTLSQLRETQSDLVRMEELASLGGLAAGVAHEINTPLGICVTVTSHVQDELRRWRAWSDAGAFDADKIKVLLDELDVAMRILDLNTRRGADLVRSFKQVAVDQSSGQRRLFDLAEYIDEILLSLRPRLKRATCRVQVDCPRGIRMDSFPGALSHVVTNLVMNALLHAFDGRSGGLIRIQAEVDDADVVLSVSDDGVGMDAADLEKIFEPFFTTKRGKGGTGLGAHIVFNQINSVLGGTIQATSTQGAGLHVQMRLPLTLGSVSRLTAAGTNDD